MSELSIRREKLFASIPENSVVLLFSGVSKIVSEDEYYPFVANRNFFYLTGIEQENSTLMLIKTPGEHKSYLFLDEYNELKERWTGKRLSFEKASQISDLDNIYSNNTFEEMLSMALAKENNMYGQISNLFIDLSNEIKIKENCSTQIFAKEMEEKYPHLKIENIYSYVVELRLVKSDLEVRQLEEAINATSTGINDLLLNLKVGVIEHELSDRFEYYGKTHGRRKLSFETIVATGKDATILHHPISQQEGVVKDGELVLFDLGYQYNGYSADISRTFPVNGTFTDFQRRVYEAVLNCNKAVIDYVKPGLTILELQEYAISFFKKECKRLNLIKDEEEISKLYIHNVSHFLGLDTHDVGDRKRPLVPGNVITVEPGLYFVNEGVGVRIEDDVLVTETGSRCLSRGIKKEISDIEKMLKHR
jgi:Xaa-Pro aminopeptidase